MMATSMATSIPRFSCTSRLRPRRRGREVARQARKGTEEGAGRKSWDAGRFLSTLLYFNRPPSPGDLVLRVLRSPMELLSGNKQEEGRTKKVVDGVDGRMDLPAGLRGVVLVPGATGGVGKRVVAKLLERGCDVRALVRDAGKAGRMLSDLKGAGKLEIVAADITQEKTLRPEMFQDVSAVVCCTAVKVAPKEGDDEDRSKYYQGIQFYDPEIVGDTPETVEYAGIRNLIRMCQGKLGQANGLVLAGLNEYGKMVGNEWGALDDVVMGGISQSNLNVTLDADTGKKVMLFTGNVSEENNGGFISVRTRNYEPPLDLLPYDGIRLRIKGNGMRYKFIVRTEDGWDTVGYCQSFDTVQGEWQDVDLAFKDFFPTFRAKTMTNGQTLDPSRIYSFQLMLSKFEYDGKLNPSFSSGRVSLPISCISAYMAKPAATWVHVSSAGVTRPNRPGIDVEAEPPAVKLNDALGGILSYKLRGEDAVRDAGMPFAVVRPCALTEEPAGAELVVDQGDTIKGKISRDDVAELCVALLSQPEASSTTFEIKSTVPFSTPWEVDPQNPPPPREWGPLLSGLQKKVTGKTIGGVYTGRQPEDATLSSSS